LIAQQYKISDDDIKKANPDIHDPNNLQVGKVIKIPSAAGGPVNTNPHMQQHKVKQGETLYLIARQYKVSDDDIKKANPGIDPGNLPVGSTVNIPIHARGSVTPLPNAPIGTGNARTGTIVYRVHHYPRYGRYDTIGEIARKFNIKNPVAIKGANPKIHGTPKEGTLINIPIAKVPIQPRLFKFTSIHEKVWNFFINKGFSATATAGIMGNLQQESDMKPNRYQDNGGPGRGIGQWEEKRGGGSGRWNQLVKFAGSWDNAWNLNVQLEYMLKELKKGPWEGANYLDDFGGYESLKKMGIYQAVVAFECSFELAGDPRFHWRFAFADAIYRRFARGVVRARA
jgi:LysM repeat protein